MQPLALELSCDLGLKGSLRLEHTRKGRLVRIIDIPNTKTDAGRAIVSGLLIATGTAMSHIAIGTGTPSGTALGAETHRQAAQRSQVTTAVTNDTAQYDYTFSFAGSYSITEAGLFNAAAGPTMVLSQSFASVDVESGDSLRVLWKLQA